MKGSENYPVDFVVLWVDGSDKEWLKKKQKYKPDLDIADSMARYRDWGIFKYWFRAVEEYAPWVNHIYLVTDKQKPKWINEDNQRITIVDHEDIIDRRNLPTFNSQAIEMNLHKIPGLSEHFVYFNDDMFLSGPVKKKDFFKKGLPVEIANINAGTGIEGDQLYARTMFNDILLINRHFNKRDVLKKNIHKWLNLKYGAYNIRTLTQLLYPYFTGYKPHHGPTPLLKTTYETLWRAEEDTINNTCSHKFRHNEDVNQYIFLQWQLCEGKFIPRRKKFGRLIKLKNGNIDKVSKTVRKNRRGFICINDNVDNDTDYEELTAISNKLKKAYDEKLPRKSSYEK